MMIGTEIGVPIGLFLGCLTGALLLNLTFGGIALAIARTARKQTPLQDIPMDDDQPTQDDARSLRRLLIAAAVVLTFPIWGTLFFWLLNSWALR